MTTGWALNAAVLVFVIVVSVVAGRSCAQREARAEAERADSLAAEVLAERATAAGWQTRFAETTEDLGGELASRDSQLATLAREVEAARAELLAVTSIEATAGGTATADVEISGVEGSEPGDSGAEALGGAPSAPDSLTATFADGPLDADLACSLARRSCALDWSVTVTAELVHARAGNRLLVFARSQDPRVELSVPAFEYQLPSEEGGGLPWKWIAGSAAAGAVAALLLAS